MATYGYARVSTEEQGLEVQIEKLKAYGCDVIKHEKVSGSSTTKRTQLMTLLEFLREGDTLVVTRIDRLARSLRDLLNMVEDLSAKGVFLKAIDQNIDTGSASGKAFLQMLGVFAEFELHIRHERQMEGIRKAKEKGVYKGGKKRLPREKIIALKKEGMRPAHIADELGIARASVYRVLEEAV